MSSRDSINFYTDKKHTEQVPKQTEAMLEVEWTQKQIDKLAELQELRNTYYWDCLSKIVLVFLAYSHTQAFKENMRRPFVQRLFGN